VRIRSIHIRSPALSALASGLVTASALAPKTRIRVRTRVVVVVLGSQTLRLIAMDVQIRIENSTGTE
jgi:hypothetical protein